MILNHESEGTGRKIMSATLEILPVSGESEDLKVCLSGIFFAFLTEGSIDGTLSGSEKFDLVCERPAINQLSSSRRG
jgi:hypothetical protein